MNAYAPAQANPHGEGPLHEEPHPPNDANAERAILGAALMDPEAAQLLLDHATGSEFYRPGHRVVCECIAALMAEGKPCDFLSVLDRVKAHSQVHLVAALDSGSSAAAYVSGLMDTPCATSNVPVHVARLAQIAELRRLHSMTREIHEAAMQPGADAAQLGERLRDALERGTQGGNELARATLSGPDFLAAEMPKPRALLGDGLLSAGELAILHAASGLGKTFLGEQFGHSVAAGEPFLGCIATPPGGVPVIVVQLEASPYRLQQRRRTRFTSPPAQLYTLTADQIGRPLNVLDAGDLNKLVRLVQSKRAELVIFDPLQELHDGPETNETFHLVVRALRRLMLRTGAAVLLNHHEPKELEGKTRSDLDAARGGTRLVGGAKLTMRLKKTPQGHHVLTFPKVSYADTPADLYLKRAEGGWWEPTEPPPDKADKTAEAIESALLVTGAAGAEWATLEDVSRRAGGAKTRQGCRDALDRIARKHSLSGWESLNVGTTNRPRFVHHTYKLQADASQGGLQV